MEALLMLIASGIVLLVPLGAFFGFIAFRRSHRQALLLEELEREVGILKGELARLKTVEQEGTPASESPLDFDLDLEPAPKPLQDRHEPESTPTWSASEWNDTAEPAPALAPRPVAQASATGPESPVLTALKENWMVWLGAFSVSLAGIFLVSHSISAGLIGPAQQVLLALMIGLALHAGAEFMRRRHMGTDQVFAALAGGGSVTLYAALLAGVHLYDLMGPAVALVALAGVSLVTMVLALLHGPLLAVMGLSGAYLVPLLVGGEGGNGAFLLGYSFLITLSSLLLLRYVYRLWLWHATLAGALLWWLLVVLFYYDGLSIALYLTGLFGLLVVRPGMLKVPLDQGSAALLMLMLAWAGSISEQPLADPVFMGWLMLLPLAVLAPLAKGPVWYLPWAAVLATFAGWIGFATWGHRGDGLAVLDATYHGAFLAYLGLAAVVTGLPAVWQWQQQPGHRRWPSLLLLAPVAWLVLGWILTRGGASSIEWAVFTLVAGGLYGAIAWFLERHERYRLGVVWALLAAHACYSLAVVMWLQEASLTLALSAQFVSLMVLAKRYQASELHLLLKAILAVVVARLTFNPWLDNYEADAVWTLFTYGGVILSSAIATRLARGNDRIRMWLEGATLHFLVLFLGAVLRYWLYDGAIFANEYGLTEAAVNTALWGTLGLVYSIRAGSSVSLRWLYRLLGRILLVLAGLSYLTLITVNNPWWQGRSVIGATPVFNLLLLAYGVPVLLALAHGHVADLIPKRWAQYGATVAFLLFSVLEIRHLWQGSAMALHHGISEGELYTYSVVGMVYAIVAILWSVRHNSEWMHKGGMALLGVVIAKIFLIDMSGLQGLWRAAAFMGLGLALLGLAWMYRKTSHGEGSVHG